jgi:hypothetical protein
MARDKVVAYFQKLISEKGVGVYCDENENSLARFGLALLASRGLSFVAASYSARRSHAGDFSICCVGL